MRPDQIELLGLRLWGELMAMLIGALAVLAILMAALMLLPPDYASALLRFVSG